VSAEPTSDLPSVGDLLDLEFELSTLEQVGWGGDGGWGGV